VGAGNRTRRRRLMLATTVASLLLVTGCATRLTPLDPAYAGGMLTSEASDTYGLSASEGTVTISAPASNVGSNTRMAFWQAGGAASTDQQTCATWDQTSSPGRQHGAALRARTVNGRTSAITITNNVLFGGRWGFNIHVMDSGMSPTFHQIGGFDLGEVFRPGAPENVIAVPLPWRMCARAIGDVVSFIVWPLTHPQPEWGDPRYGGSVQLPAGWSTAGTPGWYMGHLEAGYSASFSDLVAGPLSTTEARRGEQVLSSGEARVRQPTWIARAP
jgi:hypothetical protein